MLDDLTLGEVKLLKNMLIGESSEHPYDVGKNVFIRTVTHHYTGRLIAVYQHELVIEDACWIADDGRFADALAKCEFNEVEPFQKGKVIIGRGAILDCVEIKTLPSSQK